jgi:plasmid stability protein
MPQTITYICEIIMLRNTTFNLPDELVAQAKAYAATHNTTVTALIREHLEAVVATPHRELENDPLLAYSLGKLGRSAAIDRLQMRDYAELLVALGEADLPMPQPPRHEVENQAMMFSKLWNQLEARSREL